MKISNEIAVGVDIPTYCEYYRILQDYVYQLYSHDEKFVSDEYILVRLNVYARNNSLYEEYYIKHQNDLLKITNVSNTRNGKNKWEKCISITEDKVLTKFEYTFDINYFINTN